ncbi:Predicted arabinose efflux permease, MFS family [Actinokineospora alba]|uniref:Predicted arabinose efflux permease, MFS family n=1 Tax=Actinokineospora alba TaxID=504798 RepID=A0A1H0G1D2_9PSEU|nr:MFS transporter [Actinokineospora alba]TDP69718.1 putative MFS family arabinose efflux permease [Actinokineospora alba]SDI10305.1 Predicted arabinose efflux permease, MFS family [Actinokineospora alba]SDO00707.1 Predicted arabinose efflux permease, MFS family [Actinokineospora alba]
MTQTAAAPARTKLPGAFHYLWGASFIATLGDGVLLAALPLMAKSLSADPQLIAGVATAGTAPWLLALVVGVVVDRHDRKRLMMLAQLTQCALVVLIAVIATTGLTQLWMLFVLAFGIGSAEVLFTAASQAFVPSIVGRDNLETANGRLITTQMVSKQFLGPPLGGALFAFALPLPFWLNTITFAVSVVLIARVRRTAAPAVTAPRRSMAAEIGEGLRWLFRNRLPRVLTLGAGAGNFCEWMALSVLVLFATEVLHLGDQGFGLLLGAMAIGGVIGGLVSGRAVTRFGARQVAIGAQLVCPFAWLAIGLVGRDPVTVVLLFTAFSTAVTLWSVVSLSARQRLIPDALLGRVTSASRMLTYGAIPLGALCGGFIAKEFGLIAPWIVGGVLSLLVTIVSMPAMLRWDKEVPD